MTGEFLREAAVLIAVFVPMDRIVGQRAPFTPNWAFVTFGISASFFVIGAVIERNRKIGEDQ